MLAKALNLIAKEADEKVTETAITAKETADLGAIKPPGFGSLIRKRFSDTALSRSIDGLYSLESLVLCQDNGHIKPLFFSKISKMHKLVAFIPRFA